jgi:peptidyl-prolyl cis-trans isomerase SurA
MIKMRFIVLLILLVPAVISAQQNEVLIRIGSHEVSKGEFERIYNKNNRNLMDESGVKSPEEYLGMYVNFKLKVLEAMKLRMDTARSFKTELAGYRKDLAAPYLTDMKYDEEMVRALYDRMKMEVSASHILFRVNQDAGREQELAALQKAQKVKNEILNGKDFHAAALEYSEDPSARSNKGSLGYFSAFQMVTPFENMAFSTPVGEVSEPVRTSFGYHLIKVHDLRENRGEVKVAHIMKIFPRDEPYDKNKIKAEIDSVYNLLIQGADFAELAASFSDDKRSASEKGEMPWFSANQMIPEFSEPAFALKNRGDISKPVETQFGYHIIKKIDQRPVPSFDESRERIVANIKKDPERSSSTRKVFVEKLKKEYGFTEAPENFSRIKNIAVNENIPNDAPLFTIDSNKFYISDFRKFLQKQRINEGIFDDHYKIWEEAEIINLEDSRLEEKHPEFRYLMQEYHDGLLFFNIMEDKIWKTAADDTIGLINYYRKNPKKFFWEERFKGIIISCHVENACQEAEKYFDSGMSVTEVEDILNQDENVLEITEGMWEKGDNPVVDYFVWSGPAPAGFNPSLTMVRGETVSPEPKKLDEAKGLYISAYQEYLEERWLQELRKKYKIKVNKKLLKTISHV